MLKFKEPRKRWSCGTKTYPAIKIPGVVFTDEDVLSFELVIAASGQRSFAM